MTVSFPLPSRCSQRSALYHSRDYRLSLDRQASFLPDTLFDTIAEQQAILQRMPSNDIKALIVLTDGNDDVNPGSLPQLLQQVTLTGANAGLGVKIFTIAYGEDANQGVLKSIAEAAGGHEYPGDAQDIQSIYELISQFW